MWRSSTRNRRRDAYEEEYKESGEGPTIEYTNKSGASKEGYAVLKRDPDTNEPITEAYFIPNETVYFEEGRVRRYRHPVDYPLLVPIINRPDAMRPFGHSRISRTCMSIMGSAIRTIKRSEISAEFFSYPQKYVTGLSEEAEMLDKWSAAISALLQFTKDEDGDSPSLGQFQQQSMAPHLEQLRMFASLFAGETGLTVDDLGFPAANPTASEAIKASYEMLRMQARKAQRSFESGFMNVGYVAACLRDDYAYRRNIVYLTKPQWAPVFEPDAAALASIGDSLYKLEQVAPGYVTEEKIRELTGI